jgi:hypothetical protein
MVHVQHFADAAIVKDEQCKAYGREINDLLRQVFQAAQSADRASPVVQELSNLLRHGDHNSIYLPDLTMWHMHVPAEVKQEVPHICHTPVFSSHITHHILYCIDFVLPRRGVDSSHTHVYLFASSWC